MYHTLLKGSRVFVQHFKCVNWQFRFLMSRTGYMIASFVLFFVTLFFFIRQQNGSKLQFFMDIFFSKTYFLNGNNICKAFFFLQNKENLLLKLVQETLSPLYHTTKKLSILKLVYQELVHFRVIAHSFRQIGGHISIFVFFALFVDLND